MAVWQKSDLQTFAATVEPHVSVLQGDGKTFTKPIPIWAVAVDDMLYARSYLGQK